MSGLDIDSRLRVTTRDAAAGVRREIRVMRIVRCSACLAAKRERCSECSDGLTTREERLTVRVPAGIASGTKLRLAGKGHESMLAPTGDVFLTVDVQEPKSTTSSPASSPAEPAERALAEPAPAPTAKPSSSFLDQGARRSRTVVLSCLAGLALVGLGVLAFDHASRAELGEPCTSAKQCRSGQCLTFDRGTVCSDSCAGDNDCPPGMLCGRPDGPHPSLCVR
jgi:hypothetical protein